MEELWDDLRSKAGQVPVPQWHKDLLEERERLVETGAAQFGDWETAKRRITEQISANETCGSRK
jgi:hypothetical protein